jgi:putative transcriptional regulator
MKKSKVGKPLAMPGMPQEASLSMMQLQPGSVQSELNLANHFLIAMPSMSDPIFGGTVVYICEHNDKGVLGVVINKPTDMTMDVLFDRIDLKVTDTLRPNVVDEPIMFGGPVQDDRGFVLHSPGGRYSSSLSVTDDVAFTTSIDVLEAVANGTGPQRMLVSIGYAGWSPGQLEEEIARNGWLTVGADARVLFDLPIEERYTAAIKLLGIDPMMLATEAGHA